VNLAQVKGSLEEELERRESGENVPSPAKGPGFVFCFTGQGAPYAGMGADLFANYASFRMDITRYDQLCVQMGFPSIKRVFQDDKHFESATPAVLQLAHVCFQMALYRLWLSFGLEPKAVVGHSLGEYAALFAAGSLSQAEVIHLVGKRVELMTMKLSPFTHQMLVARTGQKSVELVLGPAGQNYEFCCINANNNIVLGGTIEQIKDARTRLEANTIRCHVLDTPYSFHSSQVDPILDDFAAVTLGTTIKTPKIPIISPTHNSVLHEASEFGSDYFVKHCRHPVNMLGALTTAKDAGLFNGNVMTVEIGPAPVIVNLIKEIVGPTVSGFASVGKGKDTSDLFTQALAGMYKSGASINWSRYHEDFPGAQHVLELPTYGWELKEYWMQYVHSWSLRKGEPPLIAAPTRLESSSIHEIKTNTLQGKEGELVVEADLTRSDLHPMVQGHKVYGVPLCTPSVYADIALTIGEHVKQTMGDSTFIAGSTVVVADMNIQSALVANANGETQVLRTVAKYDPARHGLALTFSTIAVSKHETPPRILTNNVLAQR
jgi:naphtho-gamma-pyrone polyketide synthase